MLHNPNWEFKINVDPTAKLLRDAADLMEKHGHCQGKLRNSDGQMCFLGSIYAAGGQGFMGDRHTLKAQEAVAAMNRFLKLRPDPRGECLPVVEWNNTPGRTGEEVIAAMRAAADQIELV